ncbi:MAG: primosomal protein N' [Rhodospirillales bacterium]|nr:primosomal protein N' [Rhodospirillales bacterium]
MYEGNGIVSKTSRLYQAGERVAVLLPLALPGAYDYRVPADLQIEDGAFVEVPLGSRRLLGAVWGPGEGDVDEGRLREILGRCDAPPLQPTARRFVDWVAAYTVQPRGAVLRMIMSVPEALRPARTVPVYALPDRPCGGASEMPTPRPHRPTAARSRVLAVLADGRARTAAELTDEAGVSSGVVGSMAAAGLIAKAARCETAREDPLGVLPPGPVLSVEQAQAADRLRAALAEGFSVTLVDGVPGSGKTEVYFEAIAAALAAGGQVLVLLPEIALGAQWLARFRARFGADPHAWHSELGRAERRRTWRRVAEGSARVVVGARSALFLPFARLSLIVIDEEHDASYKQEDGVPYNARDMAVVRARLGNIPVCLVSATPSLETVVNVRAGRYGSVLLPARHGGRAMPAVELIDLRRDRPSRGAWLAPSTRAAIGANLDEGAQALLFLNRRGYAPLTLCRACGHRLACAWCSAWLVEHRLAGRMLCHHCGHAAPLVNTCPACGAAETLAACGPGVERLAEEVAGTFPDARVCLATSDTLPGPAATAELVRRMEAREIDIVIGTQIIAKGYHFPHLTLVVVVDADLGLAGGDLRAGERTFQLLYQAAGRAGRGDRPGRALVQTTMPHHPAMTALASGARDRFLAAEEAGRREAEMPPYGRLAALIVSGADPVAVEAAASALADSAPNGDGVRVFGPAPAPLALLRGRHRRRLLLHAGRAVAVPPLVRRWLAATRMPGGVRVQVDIDPYSFL